MKEHFKPKNLIFYTTIIGFVLVLFRYVSAYGEKNLSAPPNFGGRYLSTTAPPGCPENSRLELDIQQSGIFLNGLLTLQTSADPATTSTETATSAEENLSLSGRWQQDQIHLSGTTAALASCQLGTKTNPIVTIQGQVDHLTASPTPQPSTPTTFTGQLTIADSNNNTQPWSFTAQRQAESKKTDMH